MAPPARNTVILALILCLTARGHSLLDCGDGMIDLRWTMSLRFDAARSWQLRCEGASCQDPAARVSSVECRNLKYGIMSITEANTCSTVLKGSGLQVGKSRIACPESVDYCVQKDSCTFVYEPTPSSSNGGAIGGSIGGFVTFLLMMYCIWWCCCRKRVEVRETVVVQRVHESTRTPPSQAAASPPAQQINITMQAPPVIQNMGQQAMPSQMQGPQYHPPPPQGPQYHQPPPQGPQYHPPQPQEPQYHPPQPQGLYYPPPPPQGPQYPPSAPYNPNYAPQ
ncbi:uncharacterized protein LOC100906026 [Galendromus occidentalis]|uniref:Uncharacterized protein LOC100906026 n=1 Tax=Galendromus occidentalis TaxID=34638 RepID=A0AAJ6QX46_9ACAR|nr:uncharacterized protein LOC100906026 [Galendromus occidentalis]